MPSWVWPTVAATVLYGLWAFLPRLAVHSMAPGTVIFYELVGGLIFGIVGLAGFGMRADFQWPAAGWGMATGVCAMLAGLCYLIAVQRSSVTLAATLTALYPVVTVALAGLVLGETLTLRQWVGFAFALVAVALLTL